MQLGNVSVSMDVNVNATASGDAIAYGPGSSTISPAPSPAEGAGESSQSSQSQSQPQSQTQPQTHPHPPYMEAPSNVSMHRGFTSTSDYYVRHHQGQEIPSGAAVGASGGNEEVYVSGSCAPASYGSPVERAKEWKK